MVDGSEVNHAAVISNVIRFDKFQIVDGIAPVIVFQLARDGL